MCVVTAKPKQILLAASATPLAFEVLAAATTLWNAMDRPRQSNTPLQRELAKDGFKYFLVYGTQVPISDDYANHVSTCLDQPRSTAVQPRNDG
jgi:hypothetical protein